MSNDAERIASLEAAVAHLREALQREESERLVDAKFAQLRAAEDGLRIAKLLGLLRESLRFVPHSDGCIDHAHGLLPNGEVMCLCESSDLRKRIEKACG